MSGYQAYTLAQIRAQLQQKIESVPFWVNAEADAALNEALLVWNSLTGYWKTFQTITTTPNSWDYALSASLVFGTRVEYEGKTLTPSSMIEMDEGKPGWQSQTTLTGGTVPTTPQIWLPMSIDLIAIWPADSAGGHTLHVDGISQTPQLTADGDYISIGQESFNAILNYALHVLALKEGGERFKATLPLFKDFIAAAAEENDQLTSSAFFRQFIGTDEGRQAQPTHGTDNDYKKLGS